MAKEENKLEESAAYAQKGTSTEWYRGWDLTEAEREIFRKRSRESQLARINADKGLGPQSAHPIYQARLKPEDLMEKLEPNGFSCVSLFSGGGGLDLGFERAGFEHLASYDILPFAGDTLRANRPNWKIFAGSDGDVVSKKWTTMFSDVDVLHGGPPCQPFSTAGNQLGEKDVRDMFPEFVRAVLEIKPRAFVAENVSAIAGKKFADYLDRMVLSPLGAEYKIITFKLEAASFGVPQRRTRFFIVGFRDASSFAKFSTPLPTHVWGTSNQPQLFALSNLERTMGVREALGLPDIGSDDLAPTIRSALTGPRHTTSILSSTAAKRTWEQLQVWPNGVAASKAAANSFPAAKDHYRLSVPECAMLQGFPEDWTFVGATYQCLGLIGNSVAPPMAYHVGRSVAFALSD